MSARQEDFVFAEHVLRRGFATEEQVQQALELLARVRGEMELDETLEGILLKRGYLAQAQAQVIRDAINPAEAGRSRNQIEGYRLLSRLGSGAMGSVYKALHVKLDILVALKVLRVELAKSTTQVERLKREAQLAARLDHPNIVRSLDVGESNGFHYFAMEFVDGPTARGLIRDGRMKEKDALVIITAVARALEHAHANGVIHRDVKPANIMLSKEGAHGRSIKLGDFGLARGQGPSELTLEHAAIGTPQYLAPEQAAGAHNASPRSDLFSLGATLYHLVTGQPPFTGENLAEIFGKVIQGRFDPPESVVDDLSVDTLYLIHRLMRPHPRDRYASASELVADLERMQAGERIAPADFKGDYQSFLDRRRQRRLLIGAASVVVIAASAWFTVDTVHTSRERERALAECRTLNEEGRGELDALDTLAALSSKQAALKAALEGTPCAAELVAGLTQRLEGLERDVQRLAEAEEILGAAQAADANYRALMRKVDPILPALDGARRRRDAIKAELTRLSSEQARKHQREVYLKAYAKEDEGIAALTALLTALDEVYLPIDDEWAADVGPHLRGLQGLKLAYASASEEDGHRFDEAIEARDFDSAATYLGTLHQRWGKARLRAANLGLPDRFLQLFPDEDGLRRGTLVREEEGVWSAVKAEVAQLDSAGRPDLALKRVEKFLSAAQLYRKTAEQEQKRIKQRVQSLQARQLQAFDELERTFRSALAARQYAAAVAHVTTTASEAKWFGEAALMIGDLQKRAQAIGALENEFWAGLQAMKQVPITRITGQAKPPTAPGSAFARAEGDTPDRYVLRLAGKDYPFTLKDLDRATLESIFGFADNAKAASRSYFQVAEAYRIWEQQPYEARDLLKAAQDYLSRARDRWHVDVGKQILQLDTRIRSGESSAEQLRSAAVQAIDRKDWPNTLEYCTRLQTEFGWTQAARGSDSWLSDQRRRAKGYVGFGMHRRNSAIPPENYIQPDPKQPNLVRIRYTGAEWHPLARDVPPGEANPEAWLAPREKVLFQKQFLGQPRGIQEFDEFYRRATHQLLDWGGAVDVRQPPAGGGETEWKTLEPPGYMLRVPQNRSAWEAWWHARQREFDDTVIHLVNHFRPDQDWSLECTVKWDKVRWHSKTLDGTVVRQHTEEMAVPDYFAVSAGRVQAAIGYFPYANGGVAGTRIFLADSMTADDVQSDQMGDFHWNMAVASDRKAMAHSDRAWLDQLRFASDSAYRIRLERAGSEIHFRFMPLDRFKAVGFGPIPARAGRQKHDGARLMHIWYKADMPQALSRAIAAGDGAPVFRFTGRVRFVLRDVEVMGYLPDDNGS